MAAKNKFLNAMKMPSIDDMFSSEADRQRESGDLVTEVPLSELHPFVGHPFEVRDDEDVQTVDDTHFYVGSRFCHIQQYANQCFKRGCYVEPEHPQPGDKLDRLLIYQIPHYTCEYRFTDYDYAQNKLKATDYRCAYVANMPRDYTPDKCFRDFNYDDRPCANSMPSLSVSDLIVMERGDKAEALYVDAVGFKDVSRLLPELHDMEVERQEHNLDELER